MHNQSQEQRDGVWSSIEINPHQSITDNHDGQKVTNKKHKNPNKFKTGEKNIGYNDMINNNKTLLYVSFFLLLLRNTLIEICTFTI